jgi:hypothetical protein
LECATGECAPGSSTGGGSAAAGGSANAGGSATAGGIAGGGGGGSSGSSCPADALFCDSFETGLDSTKWQVNGNAATFTIDATTPARDGSKSLHMAYGRPYGRTGAQSVQIKPAISAPDDRLYLRTYLRFGNLGLPGAHPSFIHVSDSTNQELGFGSIVNDFAVMVWGRGLDNALIWYEGGGNQWHPGVENGDATPLTENSVRAEQWFCLEMMYFGDHQGSGDTSHPNEEVKVWIDGTQISRLSPNDAFMVQEIGRNVPEHWSPIYDNARWRFGVESFGPSNVAIDLWFDGLVISRSRVGCQP